MFADITFTDPDISGYINQARYEEEKRVLIMHSAQVHAHINNVKNSFIKNYSPDHLYGKVQHLDYTEKSLQTVGVL